MYHKTYNKAYYEANKEKILKRNRLWREKQKELKKEKENEKQKTKKKRKKKDTQDNGNVSLQSRNQPDTLS